MRLAIQKLNINQQNFLRQCGYVEISNPHKNNEISYARSLDPGRFYPRFHIYIESNPKQIMLNLHLDAKKPSYEGSSAHSGEYDGAVVENESQRIQRISEKIISKSENFLLGFKTKTSWWKKIISLFKNK